MEARAMTRLIGAIIVGIACGALLLPSFSQACTIEEVFEYNDKAFAELTVEVTELADSWQYDFALTNINNWGWDINAMSIGYPDPMPGVVAPSGGYAMGDSVMIYSLRFDPLEPGDTLAFSVLFPEFFASETITVGVNVGGTTHFVTRAVDYSVPEPGTLFFMGTGMVGLGILYRRRRRSET